MARSIRLISIWPSCAARALAARIKRSSKGRDVFMQKYVLLRLRGGINRRIRFPPFIVDRTP